MMESKIKTVVTITGIRPDFIRMSQVFKRLDDSSDINHILIHSGQHYDRLLSDIFFEELEIRKPDYNLGIGGSGREHFQQQGILSEHIIHLLRDEKIDPDIILFLGDSNSVLAAVPLKKEGYRIGHIEAGMRSYDKRMLEEINRTVCDHCSDFLFVYHEDYANQLYQENIRKGVHIVGNTIVEVCGPFVDELFKTKKRQDQILLDIHRPENFKYKERLVKILRYASICGKESGVPVKMLRFGRTIDQIKKFKLDLGAIKVIELIDLMSFKQFLEEQYHSMFLISDSGTAQEEPGLLNTPVIVPRDFTERPQSMDYGCSYMLDLNSKDPFLTWKSFDYINDVIHGEKVIDPSWMGDGLTSERIVGILKEKL